MTRTFLSARAALILMTVNAGLFAATIAILAKIVLTNHWPLVALWPLSTLPLLCGPVVQRWKRVLSAGGEQ